MRHRAFQPSQAPQASLWVLDTQVGGILNDVSQLHSRSTGDRNGGVRQLVIAASYIETLANKYVTARVSSIAWRDENSKIEAIVAGVRRPGEPEHAYLSSYNPEQTRARQFLKWIIAREFPSGSDVCSERIFHVPLDGKHSIEDFVIAAHGKCEYIKNLAKKPVFFYANGSSLRA
ncbi:MAG: hypothetical protein V1702_03265 [Candidatus Woesearchaeota archaeon]